MDIKEISGTDMNFVFIEYNMFNDFYAKILDSFDIYVKDFNNLGTDQR